jgi:hypothetical protein
MKIYLLRPTPSEVGKLRLVLRLGACVIPCVNVRLGIVAVVRLLVVGAPPFSGARARGVPILDVKSA